MLVKITTSIVGLEVGRFVKVSPERGMAWIKWGFAVSAGPADMETKPEPAPEPARKPGRPARK